MFGLFTKFGWCWGQMLVNIPCMEHMGKINLCLATLKLTTNSKDIIRCSGTNALTSTAFHVFRTQRSRVPSLLWICNSPIDVIPSNRTPGVVLDLSSCIHSGGRVGEIYLIWSTHPLMSGTAPHGKKFCLPRSVSVSQVVLLADLIEAFLQPWRSCWQRLCQCKPTQNHPLVN